MGRKEIQRRKIMLGALRDVDMCLLLLLFVLLLNVYLDFYKEARSGQPIQKTLYMCMTGCSLFPQFLSVPGDAVMQCCFPVVIFVCLSPCQDQICKQGRPITQPTVCSRHF